LTGSSKKKRKNLKPDIHINDVGTSFLHKKHMVGIVSHKSGGTGNAIVFDQHLIDILFIDKQLNEIQHNVCNKYLHTVSKAMHLSSGSMEERFSTGKYYVAPFPRSCILIKVDRFLRRECGRRIENRFWRLMTGSPNRIKRRDVWVVRNCADALLGFYGISDSSPVLSFQQALASP
jgi:hypothetical protein